jgi:hypothetical protein
VTDPRASHANERATRSGKLRQACLEDYDQIEALQTRNGFVTRPRDNWVAFWRDNPVYRRCNGQWPIGWVLEANGGDINGWIGNVPLAYYFRGRELLAACSSPWIVDESCRGRSLALLKQLMNQRGVDLFISATVGARAEPIMDCFGNRKVPIGTWNKAAFWVASYLGFTQIALRKRGVPLASAISYPMSAVLFCRDSFQNGRTRGRRSFSDIEVCSEFDSRFDEFWNELKRQNDNVLLAVRTQETLEWHFRDKLARQQVSILTFSQGSRLLAYAVFDTQDPSLGLKRVRLVDFQALGGAEEMLRPMLCWMIQKCRKSGIHILEVTGCWLDRSGLPSIVAPYERVLPSWIFYYKAADKELSRTLANPRVWVPSSFDGDASL